MTMVEHLLEAMGRKPRPSVEELATLVGMTEDATKAIVESDAFRYMLRRAHEADEFE